MTRRTPTPFEILQIAAANDQVHVPAEGLELLTQKGKGKNKFNAVRCEFNGIRFDSKAEMSYYGSLRLLEITGHIKDLKVKPVFQLPGKIKYIGDFQYIEDGKTICVDVKGGKGTQTRVFLNKWKQVKELYPLIDFRIVEK